jgi:hypothetical protein
MNLGKKEIETSQQDEANKFISSFTVKNILEAFNLQRSLLIVTDPSGKSVNPEVRDA